MRLLDIVFHNFWPKLISLILAMATWFYVFDVINTESFTQKKEPGEAFFDKYKFVVKEIPVKPIFTGISPEGYRVIFEDVKVNPSHISIFGPDRILENANELKTDRIDLGEYTRSTTLHLGVHSDVRALRLEGKLVEVYLPVVKLGGDEG